MLTFTYTVRHSIKKGIYKIDIVCTTFQQAEMPEALHSIW